MVVLGAAATAVAALNVEDLIELLKVSFSLRAAGPFFPFLFGHFWARGSRAGALGALLSATALTVVLKLTGTRLDLLGGADPVLLSLLVGGVVYFAGSLLWPDGKRLSSG